MDKWEKEFEEEIRKKLSDAPIDFDPSAWQRMEQRLYPAAARGGWLPRWWLRAAAAVILLAVAGIWAYTAYFSPALTPEDQLSSAGRDQPAATNPQAGAEGIAGDEPAAAADERAAGDKRAAGDERAAGGTGDERAAANENASGKERAAAEAGRLAVASQPAPAGRRNQTPGAKPGRQDAPEALSVKLAVVGAGRLNDLLPGIGSGHRRLELMQPANPANAPRAPRPVPSEAGQVEPALKRPEAGETGLDKMSLSLGVLAAPDLNGVGGLSNTRPGISLGLSLGLHFNDRLSLHSGIIYSRKPYNALPSDYHTGYSPQGLVNVAAVCDVIDIPLDLRYTIYRRGSNSIALSAGLSSYLMLREKYDYQYDYAPERQYEYKNENRHFMGIGNFGVALDRKINERMSLGIEPFVKVPLTGIGHGSVRLVSAGAALRLNFDLSKKRKISINK